MSFDTPAALLLLVLLLPLALVSAAHYRKRSRILLFFSKTAASKSQSAVALPFQHSLGARYMLGFIAYCLFYSSLVIALAGPRWGTVVMPEYYRGADVVLALDLSRSMTVRDGNPGGSASRLECALEEAKTLVAATRGVRFAVALGKGSGQLALPLTDDREAVLALLESLSVESVSGSGTNLELLLDAASRAFQETFPSRRWILLFSDGESLSGSPAHAADRAAKANIAIIALGMGTEAGGLVTPAGYLDGASPQGGIFPQIQSYLNPGAMRSIAERTRGLYISGLALDAQERLAEQLRSVSSETVVTNFRRETKPRATLFIFIALAARAASALAGKRLKKREGG